MLVAVVTLLGCLAGELVRRRVAAGTHRRAGEVGPVRHSRLLPLVVGSGVSPDS